ncbi:MAG: GIY-YIG nuclease family protein [Acidimicrobiia bacterium]
MDRTAAIPIDDYNLIPSERGVYIVFSDAPIGTLPWDPASGPAYVGKADDGLRRRIEKEHGGDTGRSTLRRSLGALLVEELGLQARPRPSKGPAKPINYTNYTFEPDGDMRLTEWMAEHLTVIPQLRAEGGLEEEPLIRELRPPLNINGWLNPDGDLIKVARKRCADEARRHG